MDDHVGYVHPFRIAFRIRRLDQDSGTGTRKDQIPEFHVPDNTRPDPDANACRRTRQHAVGNDDVFARFPERQPCVRTADGNGIVAGIDDAVGDRDVGTGINVDPVRIGIGDPVFDAVMIDGYVIAAVEKLTPAGRIPHEDPIDADVF